MLSDGKELIISNELSAGLLLHKECLQGLPSSSGVILLCPDMNLLAWHQIEHQFTSSPVLFDIPGILLLIPSGRTPLFAINETSEIFGIEKCFHLLIPGGIVVAIESLDVMVVLLRHHEDRVGWELGDWAMYRVDIAELEQVKIKLSRQ